jgi:hypothetical protein
VARALHSACPMQVEFHQLDRRWEHLRVRHPARQRRLLASLAEAGQQTPIVVVTAEDQAGRRSKPEGGRCGQKVPFWAFRGRLLRQDIRCKLLILCILTTIAPTEPSDTKTPKRHYLPPSATICYDCVQMKGHSFNEAASSCSRKLDGGLLALNPGMLQ